ncbi:MAG: Phosphate ABC transporter, periplasmic phosphate-binding protein PstS (TC 3.A.1.7.1) [uncultured Sulfurovum sp.]|uniref:Phosphate-binding protein n=1 Tax=uncultured Sulfurovum sp. TaxID=269237 RepID=A0A6S6TIG2_9BACT|nr:MAG: Phosphate ABC transporter, periplasmic phosphate-binding protein PstS (TC 3.A.1.7.1) [uncultured Sulfurovum sp.]
MTLKKLVTTAVVASIALTTLNAADLKGRGASFPGPVYKAWTSEYYAATKNQVNYTPTGSGDGVKSIKKRMVDFAGSDKPLKADKLADAKLFMFPSVVGAIVLAYNIDGVKDGELKLSREAIAGIFSGKITKWNDAAITAQNAGLKLPDAPITVAVRADKSGTTYNFTYFLNKIDENLKASKKPTWKAAKLVAGKSNSGVSANIQQIKNSIGYIEYAYKEKLGLTAAQVENKEGKYINPTVPSFQDAAKYATWTADNNFYAVIGDPAGATSYPIVAATFILLPTEKTESNKKVTAFMDWAYTHGDKAASDLGYVPLPKETKDAIRAYWEDKKIK